MKTFDDLPERIKSKIAIKESGCWEWTGSRNTKGYGYFSRLGHNILAHRAVYELLASPIPNGLEIDHQCRNPPCVNPAHLEPVTHRENIVRGINPAATHARQTHCVHGHEFNTQNTYIDPRGKRQCRACLNAATAAWKARKRAK